MLLHFVFFKRKAFQKQGPKNLLQKVKSSINYETLQKDPKKEFNIRYQLIKANRLMHKITEIHNFHKLLQTEKQQ